MKITTILFDLDGTLANTLPLCIKVYQQALKRYTGHTFSEDEVTAHFGLTEEGIFRRLLPEYWSEALEYYHATYKSLHDECNEPFEGISIALRLLKERDITMGVITGKGIYTACYTLDHLGIAQYFKVVEAGQTDAIAKATAIRKILADWKIDPQNAAYIGDTDTDMQEATAAGVLPLAASWAETATIHRLTTLRSYATFTTVQLFIDWITHNIPTSYV